MTNNEQELQEKYMELQLLEQNVKVAQSQVQTLMTQLAELESVNETLNELKDMKQGSELLVPISNGIFIKADLKNKDELTINVGADVAVEKSIPETKKLLEEQKKEIEKLQQRTLEELQKFVIQFKMAEEEFKKLAQ